MKFEELKKHLSSGTFRPAYICVGDDSFVLQKAEGLFKALAPAMPDFNVSVFSETSDATAVLDACESLPVIDQYRVVLVKNFRGDAAKFLPYLKKPNPTTVLVFSAQSLKEGFAKVVGQLEPVDCNRLENRFIINYIAKTVTAAGSSIQRDAAELLIEYCDSFMTRIATETEKLALYKLGGVITKDDVKNLVKPETDYKIFELSEAVANKQNVKAAKVLYTMLEDKLAPSAILGMIYSHFRRLLYCAITPKDDNISQLLGIKEYAVKKAAEQAGKYTPKRLMKICDGFHKADADFKAGKMNDLTALEVTVMGILNER